MKEVSINVPGWGLPHGSFTVDISFPLLLPLSLSWLHWVFNAARGLSLVLVPRLSCSRARGIFLHQGLNLCTLHWQADS